MTADVLLSFRQIWIADACDVGLMSWLAER